MDAGSVDNGALPDAWLPRPTKGLGARTTLRVRPGFEVHRFRHASFRLETLPPCRDHVVVLRLAGVCAVERWLGGRRAAATARSGNLTIVPAGLDSGWVVCGDGELAHFFIPQNLFRDICLEELGGDGMHPFTLCDRLEITEPRLQSVADAVVREMDAGLQESSMFVEALMIQLVTWLVRGHARAGGNGAARRFEPLGPRLMRIVGDYVEENLASDITLGDLASLAGMSRSHFGHRFKASFGIAPHQYLLMRRVERAKILLAVTQLPAAEIALACGFADQAHMSTAFKRRTGLSPIRFRAGMRG